MSIPLLFLKTIRVNFFFILNKNTLRYKNNLKIFQLLYLVLWLVAILYRYIC